MPVTHYCLMEASMAEMSLLHVCVRLLLYILHDNSCCAIVVAEQSYIRYTPTKVFPRPLRTHLVAVDLIPVANVVDIVIIIVVAQVAVVDETDIVDAHVVDGDEDAGVIGSFAVQPFLPFRSVQVALHPQPRLLPAGGDTVRLWQRN